MRTTLTLDADVAALIERLRRERQLSLRDIVNEGLRQGLTRMTAPQTRAPKFRTQGVSVGRCLVGNLDNVAEVLALTEEAPLR